MVLLGFIGIVLSGVLGILLGATAALMVVQRDAPELYEQFVRRRNAEKREALEDEKRKGANDDA